MTEEFVNLAGSEVVEGHTRVDKKTGKVITVKGYSRTDNSAVADRAKSSPGRPGVAASSGRFAGDRAVPVWPDAGRDKNAIKPKDVKEAVKYEGLEDTGVVDQATLDTEIPVALEILKNQPQNPAMKKLIGLLSKQTKVSLTDDMDTVELAVKSIRISGYTYISKKTGKLVRVDPYTQMRRMLNAMGGPVMAARQGITPELIDRALPGYDMRKKLFTPKKDTPSPALKPTIQALTPDGERAPKQISLPAPKPNETRADVTRKAMSPAHPLQAVRSAAPGAKVVRGKEEWVRGQDDMWYKLPRGRSGAISDKELTARLANKGGELEFTPSRPVPRKSYERSKVHTEEFNPNSPNYLDSMIYAKSMGPSFANMPEGVVDSINGHLKIEKPKKGDPNSYASMMSTRVTKKNNHYPQLIVRPDSDYEEDLMETLPAQQREGFSAPSDMHPTETRMTYEVARFTEELIKNRAPSKMVDDMYDKLSAQYDKLIKSDDGDYSAYSGREGWQARMTGNRSQELKDEIAEKLSLNATSSPEDFLAEAWTEFVGKAEPRPVAKGFAQAFQSSMDEFSDYLYQNKWVDASQIPDGVYQRAGQREISRKVSDIIDGADSDRTVTTFDGERDMRSVSKLSTVSTQVFDATGKALFDVQIEHEDDDAFIHGLEYPTVDPADMPDGTPDISAFAMVNGARYFEDPAATLGAEGRVARQQKYADYINAGVARKAIAEIEKDLKDQGVAKVRVLPRAHEDSLIYARSGYEFDPNLTDADEIQAIFGTLDSLITAAKQDAKEEYFSLPKNEISKLRRKLTKWEKDFDPADSTTWPTPKDIADFGKLAETDVSPGEAVLDHLSWAGVKTLNDPNMPDPIEVNATDINSAARDMRDDADGVKGVEMLASKVAKRYTEDFANPRAKVTGDPNNHTITVKDGRAKLFSVDITKNDDGTVSMENIHIDGTRGGARLSFEMLDSLESSYQKAGVKGIRVTPETDENGKVNATSAYALARQGYDWSVPLSSEQVEALAKTLDDAKVKQVEHAREVLSRQALVGKENLSVEAMQRVQRKIDETVKKLDDDLTLEIGAFLEKFDDPDPDNHPTPLEATLLGQKHAEGISDVASMGSPTPKPSKPDFIRPKPSPSRLTPDPRPGSLPPRPGLNPRREVMEELPTPDPIDEIEEEKLWREREVTTLDRMLDWDGDPTHDSTFEFVGKQALTFGGYAMLKTLEGYWNWANLDRGQAGIRRESVGLMFILLRLMPASLWRGAAMKTASVMTKKLKSPRPEDWPSPSEMDNFLNRIEQHLEGGSL